MRKREREKGIKIKGLYEKVVEKEIERMRQNENERMCVRENKGIKE